VGGSGVGRCTGSTLTRWIGGRQRAAAWAVASFGRCSTTRPSSMVATEADAFLAGDWRVALASSATHDVLDAPGFLAQKRFAASTIDAARFRADVCCFTALWCANIQRRARPRTDPLRLTWCPCQVGATTFQGRA